ncbi:MAG: phosphate signaling complex protein PhoU [Deltaproteobacteria bacterium]|jgi:phosphate transport system protein|nr:phosphate signaling complex protein PhoU [Deltaproteobacteria bacterium]
MVMGLFFNELASLRSSLETMGHEVRNMLEEAVKALVSGDGERAKKVIESDRAINNLENAIVDKAINLIATNQPVAGDLRFLASSLRLATELERVGDLGSNLGRRTLGLKELENQGAATNPFPEKLSHMAERTMAMLDLTLKAFDDRNPVLAEEVLNMDDEIDELNRIIKATVLEAVYEDGHKVAWGLEIINTAAHLERLGDHATNLAEETIYMARGKNVRHHHIHIL